jgi:hypothetical protein
MDVLCNFHKKLFSLNYNLNRDSGENMDFGLYNAGQQMALFLLGEGFTH